jgi:hypothetical protein
MLLQQALCIMTHKKLLTFAHVSMDHGNNANVVLVDLQQTSVVRKGEPCALGHLVLAVCRECPLQ